MPDELEFGEEPALESNDDELELDLEELELDLEEELELDLEELELDGEGLEATAHLRFKVSPVEVVLGDEPPLGSNDEELEEIDDEQLDNDGDFEDEQTTLDCDEALELD